MIAPRWRKALRDIGGAPVRTTLAVVAMAAGVFGIGTVVTRYSILDRELARTYADTKPASAVLVGDFTDDDVTKVRATVRDAELRPIVSARVRVGEDEWAPLVLFVVRDFRDIRIDRFTPDDGAWPPADDEVLLERAALSVARADIGDRITMRTADGVERSLRISGTVHAAGLAPAWMDHVVSGFVTWKSIARVAAAESGRLRFIVAEDALNERHIREVAARVEAALNAEASGVSGQPPSTRGPLTPDASRKVTRIDVPSPGRHPHADQMDTFLFLLGAFGALTFALSAVLVANMIHALIAEQLRQVGVMKAIGATTRQIAGLYLGQVSILAALALCIGMPLGLAGGRAYARFAAGILNATIADDSVPPAALALQIAIGVLVPLLVALVPVVRASRITVHQALGNDLARQPFGTRAFDRWLARIPRVPRPLMLSIRATFHRRARLALTIGMLAAGGAVFVAALNTAAAWTRSLDEDAGARRFDVIARFPRTYPISDVATAIAKVPDIVHIEYWPEAAATHGDERLAVLGVEPDTPLLALPVLRGRWLRAGDGRVVVVNQVVLAKLPQLRIGGPIALQFGDRVTAWTIVGEVKETPTHLGVYAPAGVLRAEAHLRDDMTRSVRIVTRRHDAASQLAVARNVERALQTAGLGVAGIQSLSDARKAVEDHLVIIESALVSAAVLVVLIGALGLTSTLTLNVIERTREIGILGAIGATPRTIAGHVVFEGVLIGVLSWFAAIAIAVPATLGVGSAAGRMFQRTSLDFVMSPAALAMWLALVVVLSAISSFYPAWRASRLAVREAIAYE